MIIWPYQASKSNQQITIDYWTKKSYQTTSWDMWAMCFGTKAQISSGKAVPYNNISGQNCVTFRPTANAHD